MKLYAFDRDDTVNTSKGPIKLDLIRSLNQKNLVYVTGNQKLCFEVDLIGFGAEEGTKPERLRKLEELHPDVDEYIVVDDEDLSFVKNWKYFSPENFLEEEPFNENFC